MARSRLRPYPSAKDSGIEWLGQIPAHWEARRLKLLATINDEALGEDTDPEYEVAYVDIGNVDATRGILEKESYSFVDAPSRARRIVRDGDVIVSTVRTYLRAIAPITDPEPNLVVSTGFAVIRPRSSLGTGYASYVLRAPYFVDRVVAESVGVSYPAINAWQLGTFEVAVPDVDEQQTIADFLDRETAKIDALVEKKEQLIELLQEKRTALITHAVTKGLDSNVPMKDSGIEWLGQIPEHWKPAAVKRLGTIRYGLGEPPREDPDGVPFVRATDLHRGRIELSGIKCVDPDDVPWSRDPVLREHDIIVVRSGAYTGDSAIVPRELDGAIAGYDMFMRISEAEPEFVAWALLSTFVLNSQIDLWKLRAAQPHLNAEELGDTLILMCPRREQSAIADFLDRETAKIETLIAKVGEAIERLKEYRTALISAAVTGKIDVREEFQ